MDWQTATVGAAVILSALFIGRRSWQTWTGNKAGGCSNCQCDPHESAIAQGTKRNGAIPLRQIESANRGSDQ